MWKTVWIANGASAYETALFDTGAGVCLVDYTLAKELGLKFTGRTIFLKGVSGEPFSALEAEASIYVPEAGCYNRRFVYVPGISVQADGRVIVGEDYMRSTRMGVQYGDGEEIWSGQQKLHRITPPEPPNLLLRLDIFVVGILAVIGAITCLGAIFSKK